MKFTPGLKLNTELCSSFYLISTTNYKYNPRHVRFFQLYNLLLYITYCCLSFERTLIIIPGPSIWTITTWVANFVSSRRLLLKTKTKETTDGCRLNTVWEPFCRRWRLSKLPSILLPSPKSQVWTFKSMAKSNFSAMKLIFSYLWNACKCDRRNRSRHWHLRRNWSQRENQTLCDEVSGWFSCLLLESKSHQCTEKSFCDWLLLQEHPLTYWVHDPEGCSRLNYYFCPAEDRLPLVSAVEEELWNKHDNYYMSHLVQNAIYNIQDTVKFKYMGNGKFEIMPSSCRVRFTRTMTVLPASKLNC